jgi:hypothetical protein
MIVNKLHLTAKQESKADSGGQLLEFLTKIRGKWRLFDLDLYFSCFSKPLYLQRPRFSNLYAFPAWKGVRFREEEAGERVGI